MSSGTTTAVRSREGFDVQRTAAPPRLRQNVAWTAVGNAYYAASQWAVLIVLMRLGGPEVVGEFALAVAVTTPIMLLANLRLRFILATDARGEYAFRDYVRLRALTTLVALLAVGAWVTVAGYRPGTVLVVLGIAVAKGIEAIADILHGRLQRRERMRSVSVSLILKGTLSVACLALGYVLTNSLAWGVAGLAVAWLTCLIGYDIPVTKAAAADATPGRSRAGRLAALAWAGAPLGLMQMLDSLALNTPRYVAEHHLGLAQLGVFASIAYLMIPGSVLINALGQTAGPRLANHYAAGEYRAFDKLLVQLLALGAALGAAGVLVAVVAGQPLLAMVYGGRFADQWWLLVVVLIAAGIKYAYVFLGSALGAMRSFRFQLPIHAVSLLVVAVTSHLLVGVAGLAGLAWALVAGGVTEAIAYAAAVLYVRGRRPGGASCAC